MTKNLRVRESKYDKYIFYLKIGRWFVGEELPGGKVRIRNTKKEAERWGCDEVEIINLDDAPSYRSHIFLTRTDALRRARYLYDELSNNEEKE